MIPKTIHYIWFGGEKTQLAKENIATWRRKAPDYNITEWNESNLQILKKNEFFNKALKNNAYAFASDYARLWILKQYGGIYMDTDMRLLQNPTKSIGDKELVFSCQSNDIIFSTPFIAAEPGQKFIAEALSKYSNLKYQKNYLVPNTELLSPLIFKMYGAKHTTKNQNIGNIMIYSPNKFLQPSFHSVAVHLGAKTWTSNDSHDRLRVRFRSHISNNFEAGIFRIINGIGRRVIPKK